MGLDFNARISRDVGWPRWSYNGFHRFRSKLAEAIGVKLDDMQGFGGPEPWTSVDDPIVALLDHSDCDGDLTVEACKAVAPRLREIVETFENGYDRINGLPADVKLSIRDLPALGNVALLNGDTGGAL